MKDEINLNTHPLFSDLTCESDSLKASYLRAQITTFNQELRTAYPNNWFALRRVPRDTAVTVEFVLTDFICGGGKQSTW